MSDLAFNITMGILAFLGIGSLIFIVVAAYIAGGKISDADIRELEKKAGVRHRKFY